MAIFTSRHKTSGGSYNSGILNVSANGEYQASASGYDGFNVVNVQVPMPSYSFATLEVTSNGVYNAITAGYDGFNVVNVQVPSGSNIPVIEYNNTILHNNGKNTSEQFNLLKNYFNYPVEITDNVTNMFCWFDTFLNFNQPVVIPDSVINATQALARCPMFNAPVTIGNNVLDAHSLLYGCINFNQPIAFPKKVTNLQAALCLTCFNNDIDIPYNTNMVDYLLEEDNAFGSNIYILNNTSLSAGEMLGYRDWGNRVNVYCNNLALVNKTSASTSIFGSAVEWTQMTNGYYNAQFNTYLYNNIFYETDASLFAKYHGNSTFDAVIRMSDAVTNCAQMLNLCTNFNSSVQIGENVKDCVGMLRNAYNFNQPITIPNGVVNCRTMLQGTAFNQPLTIPDSVTNCKLMLFNCVNFNSPLTIGNNVVDCQRLLEAYYYDDTNEKHVYSGGIFNQPIIFSKSVALANYALAGQQNMKSDIVLHNNACSYSWFLGNAHYEGNIYFPNGILLTKLNNMFSQKNNTSGIASIYTPQSYSEYNDAIRNYKPTGNTDTWIGDETNELVYSPTANIYIHCNWNGVIPSNNNYSSVVNAIQINSYYYGQDSDKGCQLWVTTGTYDGKSFTANAAPNMVLSYPNTTGADGYKDSIISVGQAWATSEWIGTAMGNITDGRNNYSAGDGVFAWNIYTAYHSITLWER